MPFIVFITLLTMNLSMAGGGDRVGNGGDVVICSEDLGEKYFVLDEYEAKATLSIAPESGSYLSKVETLLKKFEVASPIRYQIYRKNFLYYKTNVKMVITSLPDVQDSYETIGRYCYLRQAAFFNFNRHGDPEYFIQKNLWLKLNNDQKAVLILHELIYTETAKLGHQDSTYTRSANRILFSKKSFDLAGFEEKILRPLNWITEKQMPYTKQLENAYSERVVTLLLKKKPSVYTQDPKLAQVLEMLKMRFRNYPKVMSLITDFR